ncbi:MarR family transcriptional regulator [Shimia thalassica]|uniref:MarR family winged helix-turn-helix transcriptional regulator n=1 Tax=Shimia thalassica TaxID=1715693 RepID=UPI0027329379|nr:MarR family transcriptional regulator [Shimia thalassica]MDP2579012.1 MarR family transcriptional regulator [Shimia thalassica]
MKKLTIAEIVAGNREHWPEVDTPTSITIIALIRLNDLVMERYKEILLGYGLTQAGFEVLATLRGLPEPNCLTPTELYRSILITSGGMTKVLKGLEENALILRKSNPDDQRSRFVQLTDKGRALAEASMEAVSHEEQKMLESALTPQQIAQLSSVLMRTVNKLESTD